MSKCSHKWRTMMSRGVPVEERCDICFLRVPAQLDDSKNTGKELGGDWKSKVFIDEDWIPIKKEMDKLRRENRDLSDENWRLKHGAVASSVVQPPNPTGNELDEILDLAGFQIYPAGANKNRQTAKSKLTKYIEQQVLIGRIDEEVRSNSRLLNLQKGFMSLQEALDESFDTLHRLKAKLKDKN